MRGDPPPLVRLTGSLLPLEEKGRSHLPTLTILIKGDKRIFRIVNVEKLTGNDPDGWRLLRALFPPEVRCVGPEKPLSLLQTSEIMGRRITIEGHLYVGSRMFFVKFVREATDNPERLKPEGFL